MCQESHATSKMRTPEAATSPMDAMTGFFSASTRSSRQIRSEASASPPGESTLRISPEKAFWLATSRICCTSCPAVMVPPALRSQNRLWLCRHASESPLRSGPRPQTSRKRCQQQQVLVLAR